MPAANVAPQRYTVPKGEVRKVACAFAGLLNTDEALTGTPTVTSSSSAGAPASSAAINTTGTMVVDGTTYAANTVVTFTATFTSASTGETYGFLITAGTSVSTFKRRVLVDVIANTT